jgi:hypothetical protein
VASIDGLYVAQPPRKISQNSQKAWYNVIINANQLYQIARRFSYFGFVVKIWDNSLTASCMEKFPLTPMGGLAHRLRTLDPSLVPPLTWTEIFQRTCLQSHLQTSPPTPQKSYPTFWNPRTTFQNTPLSVQKCHSAGGKGGPWILLWIGILIFVLLRSPFNISEPYDNPFW